ncbi:SWIM zinc finger family protein [Xanthovirga aplysinae]|uniref:SWIM zinc finger family protein n=1 Tax=Xanthovirga aplysinae TaxID=2529853 RepID=UPI0012BB795D|nr:hypothetical protein [Xanthovirga aplysinae]MTI31628.1 hypothetical protein [Xanthovirga aplysinae]
MHQQVIFSYEDIKELALKINFKRGEDYFKSGKVSEVIYNGDNTFRGFVHGHYVYEVELSLIKGELSAKCGCPAGHDGICKHAVAISMAVLSGKFSLEMDKRRSLTYNDFLALYVDSSDVDKLEFLQQLLEDNDELKEKFSSYVKKKLQVDEVA